MKSGRRSSNRDELVEVDKDNEQINALQYNEEIKTTFGLITTTQNMTSCNTFGTMITPRDERNDDNILLTNQLIKHNKKKKKHNHETYEYDHNLDNFDKNGYIKNISDNKLVNSNNNKLNRNNINTIKKNKDVENKHFMSNLPQENIILNGKLNNKLITSNSLTNKEFTLQNDQNVNAIKNGQPISNYNLEKVNNNDISDINIIDDNIEKEKGNLNLSSSRPSTSRSTNKNVDFFFKTVCPVLKKFYIYACVNTICLMLIMFGIILSIKASSQEFISLVTFQNQFENTKLLTDIYVVSTFDVCDTPYEKPIFGYFPGTIHGCHCNKIDSNSTSTSPISKDYLGDCNQNDLLIYNCTTILPIESFPLRKWNNQIFCIRRSMQPLIKYFKSFHYLLNSNNETITGCTDRQKKKCIVSANGNFICIDKYEFCPLTQLLIQNYSNNDLNEIPYINWTTRENMSNSKVLLGKSQDTYSTAISNLTVQYINCSENDIKPYIKKSNITSAKEYCYKESMLEMIDYNDEYNVISQNYLAPATNISGLKSIHNTIGLYSVKADFLEYCKFDNDFNPNSINIILNQWNEIKEFLFYNMIGILALLFLNVIRTFSIIHWNKPNPSSLKLKHPIKIIVTMVGMLIKYSYLYIVYEIMLSIFVTAWNMNLLKKAQSLIDQWINVQCKGNDIQLDINILVNYIKIFHGFNIGLIVLMITMSFLELFLCKAKILKDNIIENDDRQIREDQLLRKKKGEDDKSYLLQQYVLYGKYPIVEYYLIHQILTDFLFRNLRFMIKI